MTTRDEISAWFDRGISQGSKYMLVICDTFDWDDYPSFHTDEQSARSVMSSPGSMQKFMEAYDLTGDKEAQLRTRRANCFAVLP